MELRVVLLLPLCFPGLQAQTPEELKQREGSNLSVLCPYTAAVDVLELKSWCRRSDQGCQIQVAISGKRTASYTDRARQGHVTIQDDPPHRIFSITMTDLQVEDSGTYFCAYSQSYVPLKTISLTVFKEFHRWELDSLSVQCPYHDHDHSYRRKAWCRYPGQTGKCELVVSTNTSYSWSINKGQKDRASIQDDTQERTITITMEKLQAQDSGVYWCALYTPHSPIHFTRIMEARLSVAKHFHKLELDSLSVQCPYHGLGYRSERKAWCRYPGQTARCELVVSTATTYKWKINKGQKDRTSIQDDVPKMTVTITMEKLQAQDSGVYWCAIYRPHSPIHFTRIMEVHLSVAKRPATTTLSVPTGVGQNNPPGNSTQPHPNNYIIISVVLFLLLILVLIIMIPSCIRHHKKLKRRGNRQAEGTCEKPEDTTELESTERMGSPKDDSKDLKYVTLDFKSQHSPGEPLYCNVEQDQAPRKPKDESVEYAIIVLHDKKTKNKKKQGMKHRTPQRSRNRRKELE